MANAIIRPHEQWDLARTIPSDGPVAAMCHAPRASRLTRVISLRDRHDCFHPAPPLWVLPENTLWLALSMDKVPKSLEKALDCGQ